MGISTPIGHDFTILLCFLVCLIWSVILRCVGVCGVVWVVGWGVLFPSYRLISIFISIFFLLLPIIPSPIQNVFALYDSEKVSQTIFCCDSEMKLHCSFYIIYPLLCTIFYFKISIYSYGSVLLSIYSISSYNFPPEVTVFSTIYHTLQAIMFLYIFFMCRQ